MTRCRVVCALLAALPLLLAAHARAGKVENEAVTLSGDYARMTKVCKLSDKQTVQVQQRIQAKEAALATWDRKNAEKLAGLESSAASAEDDAQKARLQKQADALKASKTKLEMAAENAILSCLRQDQRLKWETHLLVEQVGPQLGTKLSKDQKAGLEKLCEQAAASLMRGASPEIREKLAAKVLEAAKKLLETEKLDGYGGSKPDDDESKDYTGKDTWKRK